MVMVITVLTTATSKGDPGETTLAQVITAKARRPELLLIDPPGNATTSNPAEFVRWSGRGRRGEFPAEHNAFSHEETTV
jgi:hypothetical protein